MDESNFIEIEVAYAASPQKQTLLKIEIERQLSIKEAIEVSGILTENPEIDLSKNKVGVFSRLVKNIDEHNVLNAGDRIEIYRPLTIDPKLMRKKKALEQKT